MQTEQLLYDDDFMLSRLITSINQTCQPIKIIPPQIEKKNRKTFIFNYDAFCTSVRRDRQNIKTYLESELSVESSITEAGMLIIDKVFDPKRISEILEQYIKEFISCREVKCRSNNTHVVKEDRINFLICESCRSKFAIKVTNTIKL